MQKNTASQSDILDPRVSLACVLCSLGVLLGMVSFAATPPLEPARENASMPTQPANFLSAAALGGNANHLPPGVPLPPSARSPAGVSGVQSEWAIVDSPNSPSASLTWNALTSVTCISASDCWAVGDFENYNSFQTLIEHWDGSSWSIVASPNVGPTQQHRLKAVTCLSASDCWAVGYVNSGDVYAGDPHQTLTLHWDGSAWAIVPSASTSANESNLLHGVSCISATNCWTVGSYQSVDGQPQTLIEHWDGSAWSIVSSPNATATRENVLNGVACASDSNCSAVGVAGADTLAVRWDGISWSIVPSANVSGSIADRLLAVTCTSASDCWAVGVSFVPSGVSSKAQTLIERWDGASWTIVSSPNPPGSEPENYLNAVTCRSSSDCWAVGYATPAGQFQPLIEHWDGSAWSVVNSPSTGPGEYSMLFGVACISAADCRAVGYHWPAPPANGIPQTLIQRWDDSSWAVVSSPNSFISKGNELTSVACLSASDCWAVGYYLKNFNPFQTLIEHWDGVSWTIVNSPNNNATDSNFLTSVACVSESDCWAVGYSFNNVNAFRVLFLHWDGNSWTIVASPGDPPGNLSSVTCTSASNCWAVGYVGVGAQSVGTTQTVTMHWDGNSWTVVPSPNPESAGSNLLLGVNCASASDCWAVGYYSAATPRMFRTLIERWNGSSWAVVSSPNSSSTQSNLLFDVACTSPSDCWAVGNAGTETLIERWNGSSWAVASSANISGAASNSLSSVTCKSASDCWAAGKYKTSSNLDRTFIQQWDGNLWSIVATPNTSAPEGNRLYDITCASGSDCWSVGSYRSGFTLTLHYSAPPVPLSVVSRKIHGSAGVFDIPLPLTGGPGIESRVGQGTNSDENQVVFTFNTPATVSAAACDGRPATTIISGNDVAVNCSGVPNAKVINVTLTGVTVGTSSGNVSVPMAVLLGDTTASGAVNSSDISQTKSQSGQSVTTANFRQDVSVNGSINSSDISLVKSKSGTALPQ